MKKQLLLSLMGVALGGMTGCSSMLNPAGSDLYACPGMPQGVTCKTPAAVYKSTHQDIEPSEFDTPIVRPGDKSSNTAPQQKSAAASNANQNRDDLPAGVSIAPVGPRPVREPAKVVRIWIAPWVDKSDSLNLAQYQYIEIKPRTWSLGRLESASASSVVPHMAMEAVEPVKPAAGAKNKAPVPVAKAPDAPVGGANPFGEEIDNAMKSAGK